MPSSKTETMRGLAIFISDIRNCKSREAELKRVNKELANIRSKFKGDRVLDGYSKKKYVCKLLFIFLLGNEVDFGFTEAVNLMTSNVYSEKQIGYLFVSIMLKPDSDLIHLVTQNIQADLTVHNMVFQNLSLQCLSNICNADIADRFASTVGKMLVSSETADELKQSSALTLLSLIRQDPEKFADKEFGWLHRIPELIQHPNLGVVTAACSLVDFLSTRFPAIMKSAVPLVISRLFRIISNGASEFHDYTYYHVIAPWLCVKLFKILQNFQLPSHPQEKIKLNEILQSVLIKSQDTPKSKKTQYVNSRNAILFEAIRLIVHYDSEPADLVRSASIMGQFLQHRDTNMRYLATDSLCLLAASTTAHNGVSAHMSVVIDSLKNERDLTIRQKSLDLLYAMCDKNNSDCVVSEMLKYVNTASYQLKEDLVLKIAILSEKYAVNYRWYVDTMIGLIRLAGEFVADEVWHRVIQVVVNQEGVQAYAAQLCFECLQSEPCYETTLKVSAYILGEYGHLISSNPETTALKQLESLHCRYVHSARPTRCLLLSTYLKFANYHSHLKPQVEAIFESDMNIRSGDVELQQRAVEYLHLCRHCSKEVLASVAEAMPCFTDKVPNPLHRLKKHQGKSLGSEDSFKYQKKKSLPEEKTESKKVKNDPVPLLDISTTAPKTDISELPDLRVLSVKPIPRTDKIGSPVQQLQSSESMALVQSALLCESDLVQIHFAEKAYSNNRGEVEISVLNKSSTNLEAVHFEPFSTTLASDTEILTPTAQSVIGEPHLVWLNALPGTIGAHEHARCRLGIECRGPFSKLMPLKISFQRDSFGFARETIELQLPITLNKFSVPAIMDNATFMTRWKNMIGPNQEATKCDRMSRALNEKEIKKVIERFGWSTLPDVSAHSQALSGGGILHMGSQLQAGVLYRLEIFPDNGDFSTSKNYRLVVRSAKSGIARIMTDLFSLQ